jgi:3-oxoacyl-[acyl-carrier-protein] synthase II
MLFPAPHPPATPPRVVITGAGIVSPLGRGWKANAEGFRSGRTTFGPVTLFDVSRQRVKVAAQADVSGALPLSRLSPRQTARLDRAGTLLLWAALEAWQQAGWESSNPLPLVLGSTAGGMRMGEAFFHQAVESPHQHRLQPTRALHYQSQTQARLLMGALGIDGPITILSNACASGGSAIGLGMELLRSGAATRVLAGGYDGLSQLVFSGFDSLQALSPTSCRPFDAHRNGLMLGEGAALLALETLESARRSGAVILGELAGYGSAMDLHHLTQPHPQGDAALAAMIQACSMAGVSPNEVDYLNAHGTGTPLNDHAEAIAIQRWAGPRAATLPVSSTKAGIGHLLGAAGAVEAVVSLMSIREQWLPPETAWETPDPVCAFPIVCQPQDAPVKTVLSNSFGFGGVNATLILRRWS